MSPNVAPKYFQKARRLKKIKEMLPDGKTYSEIAVACGVNDRTIDRDIAEWYQSGGMEEWMREEFFELHREAKFERKAQAYAVIANLLGKTLTQRIEAKTTGQQTIIVKVWKPDADAGDSDKVPPT